MKETKKMQNNNNEQARDDWQQLDNHDIEEICNMLCTHEIRIQDYLIYCVASLCNTDAKEMMTSVSRVSTIHARWLFWYAYRYMTHEPFVRISEITYRYGRLFTEQSISNSVNKMGNMITRETTWENRWRIIKRIIKAREENMQPPSVPITITIPKNVELTIKKE